MTAVKFLQIQKASRQDLKDINSLLLQLSSSAKKLNLPGLRKILQSKTSLLVAVRKYNRIVSIGTLVFMNIPTGLEALIENVVVDEKHRGEGIGRKLVTFLIGLAQKRGARRVGLTSRPERIAANKLYQQLVFKKVDTNVYRLQL